jgi:hypothetical protein
MPSTKPATRQVSNTKLDPITHRRLRRRRASLMSASTSKGLAPIEGVSSRSRVTSRLGRGFDHRDQLIWSIALLSGELHELVHLRQDRAALWSPCDGDAAPSSELEQTLFAQEAKGTKDRVRVDA